MANYQGNPFGGAGGGRQDDDSQYNALQQDVTVGVSTFSQNTGTLTKLVCGACSGRWYS